MPQCSAVSLVLSLAVAMIGSGIWSGFPLWLAVFVHLSLLPWFLKRHSHRLALDSHLLLHNLPRAVHNDLEMFAAFLWQDQQRNYFNNNNTGGLQIKMTQCEPGI